MTAEQIWTIVLTCAITLITTTVLNSIISAIINRPKKLKEARDAEVSSINNELKEMKDDIRQLRTYCENQFDAQQKSDTAQMAGLQTVIKNDLKVRYTSWLEKGYAPMDAKDDLEKMYQVYHNLGANGVLTELRDEFLALPITPKPKPKRSSTSNKSSE